VAVVEESMVKSQESRHGGMKIIQVDQVAGKCSDVVVPLIQV
jgi:hypothetical protein